MRSLPIRFRLATWFTTVLALTICVLGAAMFFAMRYTIIFATDQDLSARMDGIAPFMENRLHSRHGDDLAHEFEAHLSGLRPGGELLQLADSQGRWIYQSASILPYGIAVTPGPQLEKSRLETIAVRGALLRILSSKVEVEGQLYTVQVAEPINQYYEMLNRFGRLAFWFLPVALILSWAGGYWLCRRALRPVDEIATMARSISAQNLSLRLTVPRSRDELQRLSETLNDMIVRLDKAFRRISEFTADAAHELRTPIALIRTTAEICLRQQGSEDDYREGLAEIQSEAEHTTLLIENLMTLARADSNAQGLQLTPMDLRDTVRLACSQGETLARAKQIQFASEIPESSLNLRGDPKALLRLLLILIDNAVKYTSRNGRVSVSLRRVNSSAVCEVTDSGIGISQQDQAHIFERFYRADRVRSRDFGGAGLGLSIARCITDAHRAVIEVESAPAIGSIFRVRIPISTAEDFARLPF